jgi:hypothetical protein
VPVDEHRFAVMPQLKQVPPLVPHWEDVVGSTHVLPEQHPAVQLAALQLDGHTPALHVPDVHATQAAPPVPHCPVMLPGSQLLPSQQPSGHEAALHTQAPDEHTWPLAQGPVFPHWHAPPDVHVSDVGPQLEQASPSAPHCVDVVGSTHAAPLQHPDGHDVASQTHAVPLQACPDTHTGPVPHVHTPLAEQPLASVGLQATQAFPSVPHSVSVSVVTQLPPASQQPLRHDAELHSQTPPTHSCPALHGGFDPH